MKTEQRNTQIIFEYDMDMKKQYLHRIIGNEKRDISVNGAKALSVIPAVMLLKSITNKTVKI